MDYYRKVPLNRLSFLKYSISDTIFTVPGRLSESSKQQEISEYHIVRPPTRQLTADCNVNLMSIRTLIGNGKTHLFSQLLDKKHDIDTFWEYGCANFSFVFINRFHNRRNYLRIQIQIYLCLDMQPN